MQFSCHIVDNYRYSKFLLLPGPILSVLHNNFHLVHAWLSFSFWSTYFQNFLWFSLISIICQFVFVWIFWSPNACCCLITCYCVLFKVFWRFSVEVLLPCLVQNLVTVKSRSRGQDASFHSSVCNVSNASPQRARSLQEGRSDGRTSRRDLAFTQSIPYSSRDWYWSQARNVLCYQGAPCKILLSAGIYKTMYIYVPAIGVLLKNVPVQYWFIVIYL